MTINLIKKEIRELLTKSTVGFMVLMSVIFMFTGRTITSSGEQAAANAKIAVVDLDNGEYSRTVMETLKIGARVVYAGGNSEDGVKALETQNGVALITIPSGFSENISSGRKGTIEVKWLMKGTGLLSSMPLSVIEGMISSSGDRISEQILSNRGDLDPEATLKPVASINTTLLKGKTIDGLTPAQIGGMISQKSTIVPVAIMMLILMGSSSVISSMGMEKENKTLETLLTMPVSRSSIIVGKVVGSAIVGMIMGAVYMVGFSSFTNAGGTGVDLAKFGLSLGAVDYVLIGVSVFFALMAALCLAIVMGTFANNLRSAQTYTFPIVGMAIFVMMVTLFQDFDTMPLLLKVAVFAIPFSHPMMAMNALMLDNYPLVIGGIVYSIAFTIAMVAIAVWIFNSDRLLTGNLSFKRKPAQEQGTDHPEPGMPKK